MLDICQSSDVLCVFGVFFFKQKTAYEMRISDWSSDVCSSDLAAAAPAVLAGPEGGSGTAAVSACGCRTTLAATRGGIAMIPPEIGRASCRERVCQYV